MGALWCDIRYGLRMLARSPGFTAVVVVILAVGIGANTAVFSVVNAVMLRPLPYRDARRLVVLREQTPKGERVPWHARFLFWREQNKVLEQMASYRGARPYVAGIDKARYIQAVAISSDLLPMLGVRPLLGRGFLPEEEQPGNDRVVILSHAFWQDDLGGTPDVIGKTMSLDGKTCTIVGVMPRGFGFPVTPSVAFWVPLVFQPDSGWPQGPPVFVLARLRKGGTLQQARAAMAVTANRLKQTDSEVGADYAIGVWRLLDKTLEGNRQLLLLLLGAAGFVLLIACSNVANLLMARAAVRQREMALRAALGASRGRVLRQMLTESVLLSVGGGVLGLLITFWTIRGLVHLCPADVPRLKETSVDWSVLAFMLGVSVLTGLVFGTAPAWKASDVRITETLKEGTARSSAGRRGRCLHDGLVVVQMGLSLILLVGAALLIRSMVALHRLDLGFRPENVLAVTIRLPEKKYPEPHHCQAFFESLLQRVRALPDVRSAGLTPLGLSLGGSGPGADISFPDRPSADPQEKPSAKRCNVSAGFLETLGMRLLRGRTFTEEDISAQTHSVVIDEKLARRYFGDTDPIGQRVGLWKSECIIVGVVSTLKDFLHLEPADGAVYVPMLPDRWFQVMVLIVRTDCDPVAVARVVRSQVAEMEKDNVIAKTEAVEATLSDMLAPRRFSMILLSLFAGIALTLATVGIYGLVHYSTTQQTRDIGIRMALGARRIDILRAVLGRSLRLTLIGVVIGLVGAVVLTRILSGLLYDVTPTDPLTLACVSLVLAVIAMLASYIPARRAARVDPMVALRCE